MNNISDFIDVMCRRFNESWNFKAIAYDDNQFKIVIVGNDSTHGIRLNGVTICNITKSSYDEGIYIYEFFIYLDGENINYATKVSNKLEIINAMNRSLELIEKNDSFEKYVVEMRDIIASF